MILITRPMPAAENTKAILERAGFACHIDSVLKVEPLPVRDEWIQNTHDAIITTSANAIEIWAQSTSRRDIPLYCVGDASRDVAKKHGFPVEHCPSYDAKSLIDCIINSPHKSLLYLHGKRISVNVAEVLLSKKDYTIDCLCLYTTVATDDLNPETTDLIQNGTITDITFFSEFSALTTMNLLKKANLIHLCPGISALCLSQKIADSIKDYPWKSQSDLQRLLQIMPNQKD